MEVVRRELVARLQSLLESPAPALGLVVGPAGVGKSGVVRRALQGLDSVRYWAAPVPDPNHRALLVARLGKWRDPPTSAVPRQDPLAPTASWAQIFDHLLARAAERTGPIRLILEEFPRLVDTRPKLYADLERFWAGVRARGLPVHLILCGSDGGAFDRLRDPASAFAPWIGQQITVPPLTFREVGALFPAYGPADRLRAWSVFGGLPRHLSACDPDTTLAKNVRRAVLSPDAPLLLEGSELLQRAFQSVPRYASVLHSLSQGHRDWGAVVAGAPDFASGAQLAPYLSRLQQLGLVAGAASLDAGTGTRNRRYAVDDPFLSFWHRFVLPELSDLMDGRAAEVWRRRVRPGLEQHTALLFPVACRQYLVHHGEERLAARAREIGGLWGADYDIEVAGTLRTGAAVYGRAFWRGGRVPEAAEDVLEDEIGRTRYGFGREARLRVVFATDGFAPGLLRRGVRSEVLHLIDIASMYAP